METAWDLLRLYEFYPNRNEDTLAETMRLLSRTGDHWTSVFEEEVLLTRHIFNACHSESNKNLPTVDPQQQWQLPDAGTHWRGMNAAKALTTLGARYRLSNDDSGTSFSSSAPTSDLPISS